MDIIAVRSPGIEADLTRHQAHDERARVDEDEVASMWDVNHIRCLHE